MARGYFYSPAQLHTNNGKSWHRPLLADAVDSNAGHWKVVFQDSDSLPLHFVVVVNDRRHPSLPRNRQAVLDALALVPGVVYLGATQGSARDRIQTQFGAGALARFQDQEVGGE